MSRTGGPERASGRGDPAPGQLLREMRAIRGRTSAAAHGYWLPLVLFGVLIAGSLPFFQRLGPAGLSPARRSGPGSCGRLVVNHPCHLPAGTMPGTVIHVTIVTALGYYWQLAIPAGVVLTVLWYRWRGNRVGLRIPAQGFLITGLVLSELVLLVPLLVGQSGSLAGLLHDTRHAGPLVIIAALLWVLSWAERSPALAVITACYLVATVVVSPFDDGGIGGGSTGAADVPLTSLRLLGLLPALILLGCGAGSWLAKRLHQHPRDALPATA
jgi:hypothetical protein